jgi:sporulation protein YlmC with PRC-barrel domain
VKSSDLKGLPAINIADGAKVGDVERAYFDPAKKHIAGFAIAVEGGFLQPERAVIADTIEVHSLGSGALTLDSAEPKGGDTSQRYGDLIDLDEVIGRDVFTEGGVHVGPVSAAEFDERTFMLASIEAAPGFHKTHRTIPVGQVTTIGPDVVVVSSAALDPPAPEVIPRVGEAANPPVGE